MGEDVQLMVNMISRAVVQGYAKLSHLSLMTY